MERKRRYIALRCVSPSLRSNCERFFCGRDDCIIVMSRSKMASSHVLERNSFFCLNWFFPLRREQVLQMRFNGKTRFHRGECGVGLHFGRICIEFLSPDESCLLTLIHDGFEKAAKDIDAIAGTNTSQAGVIR
jgi:hypothetical protein